jgi:AraC family transcriptional regulator
MAPGTLIDRTVYSTPLVAVGEFRAPVQHPDFQNAGAITDPVFVFPRTAVQIRHEGERPFTADPCTVTYYNPGQHYTRAAVDERGDACEWFGIRSDALLPLLTALDPGAQERPDSPFRFTHGPSDASAYALQRRLYAFVRSERHADAFLVEETVIAILLRVYGLAQRADVRRRTIVDGNQRSAAAAAEAARQYLLARYELAESLDDVARAAGTSVFHLCRVFKRAYGTTVHQYRLQLRLRQSLELVARTGSNLTAIAFELGFSSHSHFTAVFHTAFGTTPSEFRRGASRRRIRELTERLSSGALPGRAAADRCCSRRRP